MGFNNVDEIKKAVDDGLDVRWSNDNYKVIKDANGQYLIMSQINNHCLGLTWRDEQTMNGKSSEFYVKGGSSL